MKFFIDPRRVPVVLLIMLFVGTLDLTAAVKRLPILPRNGDPVTVIVNGKEKHYYHLRSGYPLKLQVDGPGSLDVVSRLVLPAGENRAVRYAIRVSEKDSLRKVHGSDALPSKAQIMGSTRIPAQSRKFHIKVPKGSHTYTCVLDSISAGDAAVKFFFAGRKRDTQESLAGLEPVSYERVAHLASGERLLPYYVGTKQRSVTVRAIGPTVLKVRARLNFLDPKSGIQTYKVRVLKDGQPLGVKTLASKPAEHSSYEDWKGIIPGILNEFTVRVATGEHTYRFELDGDKAHSIALKIAIPEKDSGNEDGE